MAQDAADPARHAAGTTTPRGGQVAARNRWDHLHVPELGRWTPDKRVSVVLPYYEAREPLERTLASLAAQSYPRELTQVLVVDDGSATPLELPDDHLGLDLTVLHQEDRGFGLTRARNLGARHADGDVLVFLDCDMLAERQHLEAHARWHHVCDHALSLGFRRHVEVGDLPPDRVAQAVEQELLAALFADREQRTPAWLDRHMERMAELTSDHDDLFRAVTGGNLGIPAWLFSVLGGFDPTFTQWGSEDTDLGQRAFVAGALLVPERAAACWHQGLGHGLEPHERASLDEQRARLSQTVPHPGFRRLAPGRSYRVPRVLVEVEVADRADDPVGPDTILATVESVLASELHDLEVLVRVPQDLPGRVRLLRTLEGDPRVVEVVRDDHLRTPYRVTLPAGAAIDPATLDAVVAILSDPGAPVGVLRATLPELPPDEGQLLAVSTRAVGRARLAAGGSGDGDPHPADAGAATDEVLARAGELFGQHWASGAQLGSSWAPVTTLPGIKRKRRTHVPRRDTQQRPSEPSPATASTPAASTAITAAAGSPATTGGRTAAGEQAPAGTWPTARAGGQDRGTAPGRSRLVASLRRRLGLLARAVLPAAAVARLRAWIRR